MKKIISIVQWVGIATAWGLVLLCGFWLLYPYKIAEFKNVPFPIMNENSTVTRGERVRYEIEYCKYTNESPSLTKYFIDGVIYETPKSPSSVPSGCGKIISDAYVPKAIPTGVYSIKSIAEYKVNPLRTIKITNYTQQFIVK
jgi:hypothetical protein